MIAWFARNPVAANILMLTIIAAGIYSWAFRTPVAAFPDFEPGIVEVFTAIPGASPEDVEKGVTTRIEQSFYDLEGLDEIYSVSQEGSSRVSAKVNYNADVNQMRDEIQSRVFELTTLPESALQPVIFEQTGRNRVIEIVLYGDVSPRELRDYAEIIYDEVIDLPLVSQALIDENQKYEITIEATQSVLEAYQLDLQQIANKIRENSQRFSGGNIKSPSQDVLLRSLERAYTHDEFAQLVIKSQTDGSVLRLGDFATIHDEFEIDKQAVLRFNGKPAAVVRIYRGDQESVIKIADEVKRYIADKQATLPENIKLAYWRDWSAVVKKRLGTLSTSAVQGMILVLLILALFLRPVVAAWVFIGVPVSILGAIIMLPWLGVNINVVSMLGFILLLGIVVDDAIVTGESIYHQMSRGKPSLQAAIDGTHAVNIPVTFGVLTTVAAFASMVILAQGTGLVVIFATIPAVIIPALLFSLIESKLVLPAHLGRIKFDAKENQSSISRFQRRFSENFEKWTMRFYLPLLASLIRHRYAAILGFFGIFLIAITLVAKNWLGFSFFPKIEGETISLSTKMPVGTPAELTQRYGNKAYKVAEQLRDKYRDDEQSLVLNIFESVTDTDARTYMEVVPLEERKIDISMGDLTAEWRQKLGVLPGSKSTQVRSEIIRTSDPVNIQFRGDNSAELIAIIDQVRDRLATYPGVFDIEDNFSDGKEEIIIGLNRTGHSLGLTRRAVMNQIRAAHYGIEAQRIQRGRSDIRVKVRLAESDRGTLSDLQRLRIRLPNGQYTNLAEVTDFSLSKGSASIRHVDLKRSINLTADIDKSIVNLDQLYGDLRPWLEGEVLRNYPLISYSFEGEFSDQKTAFDLLLFSVTMALLAIYAMLAIPLKSFMAPLIILSVIPFSLIGVIGGHWLLGHNITVISLLGAIGLIGVIVNDSLLISAYIINHQAKGEKLLRAVMSAGMRRFRPVFLTTLTTFFGLLPILLEQSTQARFLIPMAISLSVGIVFATTITLIQVPILFMIVDDFKKWGSRNIKRWWSSESISTGS